MTEAVARKLSGHTHRTGVEVYRLDQDCMPCSDPEILQRTNSASESTAPIASSLPRPRKPGRFRRQLHSLSGAATTQQRARAFEPQIYPNRLSAVGEAERPYDVTGWTLPLQMGIEAPAITAIQEPPGERRASLIREENEVRKDLALTVRANDESPIPNPIKRAARIGITGFDR